MATWTSSLAEGTFRGLSPGSRSMLLRNDGQGRFTDATLEWAPDLEKVGMVTSAAFADIDGDRDPDLLLCGEWMPHPHVP